MRDTAFALSPTHKCLIKVAHFVTSRNEANQKALLSRAPVRRNNSLLYQNFPYIRYGRTVIFPSWLFLKTCCGCSPLLLIYYFVFHLLHIQFQSLSSFTSCCNSVTTASAGDP